MDKNNKVFIATSIDGYISDKNNGLDWLQSVPNPENNDMGYSDFMKDIDAIVMGRNTFEIVCSFDIEWPYNVPVFVLSSSLKEIPSAYSDKVELINGPVKQIVKDINNKGYNNLYIDGGKTIQGFLNEDLIDELIITTIPILLGGGSKLFSNMPKQMNFQHIKTHVFLNEIVQCKYKRSRV